MKLSACMIVKNEEEMLRRTLPDLAKSVDEVILVDTGSGDGTVEFAKSCGARVFHFAWVDDFSAARNESLKYATGDWIIWIDADECLKPESAADVKKLLQNTSEDSCSIPVYECPLGTFEPASFYYRVKIFRNGKGVYFKRPFNEQICGQDGKVLGGKLIKDAPLYHWGNFKQGADKEKKKERNIAMLKKLLEKFPNDVNYHFHLGNDLKEIAAHEEAIKEYDCVIRLNTDARLLPFAHSFKAVSYLLLKQGKRAYQAAVEALKLDKNNCWALNVLGSLLLSNNHLAEAIDVLKQSASVEPPATDEWTFFSLQQRDYVANFLLGDAYLKKGEKQEAQKALQAARNYEATPEVMEKLKWV